ncbi:GDSL esterase/lipase [Acorus calamus]|uniref:GDSL esterase/lipase n=1 Tax=Acorus calamus TaxID=4465 RepID=A0AAV9F0G6_ACOCL|nr:GDSL esterase/lipase [Acorus calamus]
MKPFTRTIYLAFLVVGFALASASSSQRCEFPMIINFGDSISDTGGLSASFFFIPLPYGETYFHRPAGRFSDGRVLLDFMAEGLGLPFLSAYLNSLGTNFSHGVNFATAGSTIRPQNESLAISGFSPFSLDIQLSQFTQFKLRSQWVAKQGGVFKDLVPKQKYFSQALYTIDIGADDIAQAYVQNMTDVEIRAIIHDGLGILASSITSLYDEGARFFWVHNTAPIGCIPFLLVSVPPASNQMDSVGCSIPINQMAEYFNSELNRTVVQLRKELPLAVLTYVDVYSVKYKLISHADEYGFTYPLKACCGYGGGKYNFNGNIRCDSPVVVNGTLITVKSCKDPLTHVNFDGFHFTDAANQWFFDRINTGAYSDPPLSLADACLKHA